MGGSLYIYKWPEFTVDYSGLADRIEEAVLKGRRIKDDIESTI